VAVTVVVWSAVKPLAEAGNVPLLEPVGIVSEAGTVRLVELEVSPTVPPPDPLSITVQVVEAFGDSVPGLQVMELIKITGPLTVTVPAVPATWVVSPVGETPLLWFKLSGASLLPDKETSTVATTPSGMLAEFIPQATQV
jgi:hypothetical protein